MDKEFICTYEERTNRKGLAYKVLVIHVTDDYEILCFPNREQQEIIKIHSTK